MELTFFALLGSTLFGLESAITLNTIKIYSRSLYYQVNFIKVKSCVLTLPTLSRSEGQWHIRQQHYSDPQCQHGTYTIIGSGTYSVVSSSTPSRSRLTPEKQLTSMTGSQRTPGKSKGPAGQNSHDSLKSSVLIDKNRQLDSDEVLNAPGVFPLRSHVNLSEEENNLKRYMETYNISAQDYERILSDESLDLIESLEYPLVEMHLAELTLTPVDGHTAKQLNSTTGGCGQPSSWFKGVEQDITVSRGCDVLGISVPTIYKQPIKFDEQNGNKILFLGQTQNKPFNNVISNHDISNKTDVLNKSQDKVKAMYGNFPQNEVNHFNYDVILTTWSAPLARCTSRRGTANQPITASRRASAAPILESSVLIHIFFIVFIFT